MNRAAEQHLAKAAKLIAKGDEFYWKAGEEIVLAQQSDTTLSNGEIGKRFDRSASWVRLLVHHVTTSQPDASIDWGRGSHGTKAEIDAGVKKLLTDAPMEQVERVIDELPPATAAKLVQAGLGKAGVTREIAKSAEASAAVTRASGQVREEVEHQNRQRTRAARKDTGSAVSEAEFLVDVLGALLGAKRKLNESYLAARDHEATENQREAIEEVLAEVVMIVDWYRSYLSSGDQSFEQELEKLLNP